MSPRDAECRLSDPVSVAPRQDATDVAALPGRRAAASIVRLAA